ncbi:unnamed protein product, partial [Linum tenue]
LSLRRRSTACSVGCHFGLSHQSLPLRTITCLLFAQCFPFQRLPMVAHKLLLDLKDTDGLQTALKLRLLHAWGSYGLKNPALIYNYCTLWTDEEGTLIQGLAPASLMQHFAPILQLGAVYMISNFTVQPQSPVYRPCSHHLSILLSPNTMFEDLTAESPDFWDDSFEFASFASLHSRIRSSVNLTDVVGVVVSVTGVSNSVTSFGETVRREVVLQNESHMLLDITLWGEIARSVDGEELAHIGHAGSVVLGVCALRVTGATKGGFSLFSTPGTRCVLEPVCEQTHVLHSAFFAGTNTVQYYPPRFSTPGEAIAFKESCTKSVSELLELCSPTVGDATRYHCADEIISIESERPWYYLGCSSCSKAAKPYEMPDYWCEDHRRIPPEQTQNCYKVRMIVEDTTATGTFVLLGKSHDALLGGSAPELSARFPHQRGHLPPELLALEGRRFVFDVQLPKPMYFGRGPPEFTVLSVVEQNQPPVPRP